MKLNLASTLTLALATGTAALGQVTVSHTYDFNSAGPFSVSSAFPAVDPSQGTLVDVAVATWYRVDLTLYVENLSDQSISDPYRGGFGSLEGGGADRQDWWFDYWFSLDDHSPVSLTAFDGDLDNAGTSGYTANLSTGDIHLFTVHPELSLYDWLGASEIPFGFRLWHADNGIIPDDGSLSYSYDLEVTGQQTLTYTYAAVPEPATFAALFGGGALLVVVVRRLRAPRSSAR